MPAQGRVSERNQRGIGVNRPLQKRSQKTLDAITRAATELLEDKPFVAVGVHEVVARAGSSVGSFYARFADKDALLVHLHERYQVQVTRGIQSLLDPVALRDRSIEDIVHLAVVAFVDVHVKRPGAIRAFHAVAAMDAAFRAREEALNALIGEHFIAALMPHRGRIGHPDPEAAIDFAAVSLLGALLQRVLFRGPGARTFNDAKFAAHLEHAFLAHLEVRDGGQHE